MDVKTLASSSTLQRECHATISFLTEFVCFSAEELCKVLLEAIKYLEDNHTHSWKFIKVIRMAHGKCDILESSVYSYLL